MKSQKHPDQSNNLFEYHQRSIEIWLREEFLAIKVLAHPNTRISQHLFASATLVDFPQFRDIHHLIPQILDLKPNDYATALGPDYYHQIDYHDQIEDSDKWEIYVEYRKVVSRFLIDQTRSEIPHYSRWSGQEHYVSLAKYLLSLLSEGLCKTMEFEVDIPKAVLIFLPIVFSQAGRSAAALDLLRAGSFSFDPGLRRRFPRENWGQLLSSSYKACKLAIAAEGDTPTITEPTITEPDDETGTENWEQLLSSSYEACKSAIASEGDMPTIPQLDAKTGTSSRGAAIHTILRRLKGLFKSAKS